MNDLTKKLDVISRIVFTGGQSSPNQQAVLVRQITELRSMLQNLPDFETVQNKLDEATATATAALGNSALEALAIENLKAKNKGLQDAVTQAKRDLASAKRKITRLEKKDK